MIRARRYQAKIERLRKQYGIKSDTPAELTDQCLFCPGLKNQEGFVVYRSFDKKDCTCQRRCGKYPECDGPYI